jgi:hypothetical protein
MITMTLDEWSESTEAHRLLKRNMQTNFNVYLHFMTEDEKAELLRMHLIMVRQFLDDMLPKPAPPVHCLNGYPI